MIFLFSVFFSEVLTFCNSSAPSPEAFCLGMVMNDKCLRSIDIVHVPRCISVCARVK